MIHPAVGIVGAIAALVALMLVVRLVQAGCGLHPEVARKVTHIGMGVVAISFPWLFAHWWPVVVIAGASALLLTAIRTNATLRTTLGGVLGSVGRVSLGEIYYALTIAVLAVVAHGRPLLFVIPVAVLTLADALAALIGIAYGRLRYETSDGVKSVEGSVACFAVAFLSVHVPLLLFTETDRAQTLLIALIIGLLVMLLEAIAWGGIDNLLIPLGTFMLLRTYLTLGTDQLLDRLAVTVALVAFVLMWRRRATLDDSALIAAALFGYLAAMVGGWVWVVAPLTLFILHVVRWPRASPQRGTTVHAVLAVVSTPILCLLLWAKTRSPWIVVPYATAFAAHWCFVCASYSGVSGRRLLVGVFSATVLVLLPTLVLAAYPDPPHSRRQDFWPPAGAAVLAVIVVAVIFARSVPRLYDGCISMGRVHGAGALLAALAAVASGAVSWMTFTRVIDVGTR